MNWRYGAVVRHNDTGITGMLLGPSSREPLSLATTRIWKAVTLIDLNLDDADEVNVWAPGHEFEVAETTVNGWQVIEDA